MRTANSAPWLAPKIAIAAPLGEEPWAEAMRYANPTIGGVQGCEHSQAARRQVVATDRGQGKGLS